MTGTVEELVALYAEHGADGVEGSREFEDLYERHKKDTSFASSRERVEEIARLLERDLEGQETDDQVRTALQHFDSYRESEKQREPLRRLVEVRYGPRWTPRQRDYFAQACDKLAAWRDYFLSFTSHNPVEGEVLPVNNLHRRLLRAGLGRPIGPPDTCRRNFLAWLLYVQLERSFNGFYYPHDRTDEDVEDKLRRAANDAFAFVQVLDASMFGRSPNYCNLEYVSATANGPKTIVVVLPDRRAEFMRRVVHVHGDLRSWYDAVMARDAVELEPTDSQKRITKLLEELETRTFDLVSAARRRLIEDVPS